MEGRPIADIYVKRDDTAPIVMAVLRDAALNPADIAGAQVRFIMRAIRGTEIVIDAAASNDQTNDATMGNVSYEWTEDDTMDAGGYYGEFEVTYGGGAVETFPNGGYMTIAVIGDLDQAVS